jgi:hypothetical protein
VAAANDVQNRTKIGPGIRHCHLKGEGHGQPLVENTVTCCSAVDQTASDEKIAFENLIMGGSDGARDISELICQKGLTSPQNAHHLFVYAIGVVMVNNGCLVTWLILRRSVYFSLTDARPPTAD